MTLRLHSELPSELAQEAKAKAGQESGWVGERIGGITPYLTDVPLFNSPLGAPTPPPTAASVVATIAAATGLDGGVSRDDQARVPQPFEPNCTVGGEEGEWKSLGLFVSHSRWPCRASPSDCRRTIRCTRWVCWTRRPPG